MHPPRTLAAFARTARWGIAHTNYPAGSAAWRRIPSETTRFARDSVTHRT
jgi:hypothetical protein